MTEANDANFSLCDGRLIIIIYYHCTGTLKQVPGELHEFDILTNFVTPRIITHEELRDTAALPLIPKQVFVHTHTHTHKHCVCVCLSVSVCIVTPSLVLSLLLSLSLTPSLPLSLLLSLSLSLSLSLPPPPYS